ncbi:vancomycin resistance protein [Synechococcus sp. RSCCF101]|uniref:VanW family protein n=1 Tax=Synechococcus sp. RSCCF101 TaxID=2511069 RepID=UPI001247086E|nr:VanW family protein [Synechococcus sp. RSCCF101]QEY33045.1 vancomycin resistance protein [Synechococcus sp. RSCCF101]
MPRLTDRHPWLFQARVHQKRLERRWQDALGRTPFARTGSSESLACRQTRHQSLLRRRLGDSDPQLQENKIINLGLANRHIDGLILQPGEVFSFWSCVGRTTAARGYVDGMQLSRGEVRTGIGGGLCQLANLLYWMALHTPLTVSERHHHSFDPFPDEQRTLPFGSGAGVFYNYIDLRFTNPTSQPFQLRVWLTDHHLKGAIHTSDTWPVSYHVFERQHRFRRDGDRIIRSNEIWRSRIDKASGKQLGEELLMHNRSEVKYAVDPAVLMECQTESRSSEDRAQDRVDSDEWPGVNEAAEATSDQDNSALLDSNPGEEQRVDSSSG